MRNPVAISCCFFGLNFSLISLFKENLGHF